MKLFSEALSERRAVASTELGFNAERHEVFFSEAIIAARDTDGIIGAATATFDAYLLANQGKDEGMLYAEGAAEFCKTAWGHIVAMWTHLKTWFTSLIGKVVKVHGVKIEELKKRSLLVLSDTFVKDLIAGRRNLPQDYTFKYIAKSESNAVARAADVIGTLTIALWDEHTLKNFKITGDITPESYFMNNVVQGINTVENGGATSQYDTLVANTNTLRASANTTGIGSKDADARGKAMRTFLDGVVTMMNGGKSKSAAASAKALQAMIPGTDVKDIKGKIISEIDAVLKTTKQYSVKDAEGLAVAKNIIEHIEEELADLHLVADSDFIDNVKKGNDFFSEIGKVYKEKTDELTKVYEKYKGETGSQTNADKGKAAIGLAGVIGDIANVSQWYTTLMIEAYAMADAVTSRWISSISFDIDTVEGFAKAGVKTV